MLVSECQFGVEFFAVGREVVHGRFKRGRLGGGLIELGLILADFLLEFGDGAVVRIYFRLNIGCRLANCGRLRASCRNSNDCRGDDQQT